MCIYIYVYMYICIYVCVVLYCYPIYIYIYNILGERHCLRPAIEQIVPDGNRITARGAVDACAGELEGLN